MDSTKTNKRRKKIRGKEVRKDWGNNE